MSTKRKLISLFTALAMVLMLVPMLAVPVGADDGSDVSDTMDVILSDLGTGATGVKHTVSFTTASDVTSSTAGNVTAEVDLADDVGNVNAGNVSVTPASLTDTGGNTCTASISVASGNVITAVYNATANETVTLSANTDVTVEVSNTTNPAQVGTYTDSVATYYDGTTNSVDTGSCDFGLPVNFNMSPYDVAGVHSDAVGEIVSLEVMSDNTIVGAEASIYVYYDGNIVDTSPAEPETTDNAALTDDTNLVSFEIPESKKGDHDIKVGIGVYSLERGDNFEVEPKVTIDPEKDPEGSTATATCTGFADGVSIDVYAGVTDADNDGIVGNSAKDVRDGTLVGSGETNSVGSVDVSCTMDEEGRISAIDGEGNIAIHYPDTFNFEPKLELDPTSGGAGTEITASGSGFVSNNVDVSVTGVTFAGISLDEVDAKEDVVAKKYWVKSVDDTECEVVLKPPVEATTSAGTKVVKISTNEGSADANFSMTGAVISVDPTSGTIGTTVTITGSGFTPSTAAETITAGIQFEDDAGRTEEWGWTATDYVEVGSDGKFSCQITIPTETDATSTAEGTGEITVKDEEGVSDSADFEVIGASISLSPEEGPSGSEVKVTGTGFPSTSPVKLGIDEVDNDTIGPDEVVTIVSPAPPVVTDSLGGFEATFLMPNLGKGTHSVRAEVGEVGKEADFEIVTIAVSVTTGIKSVEEYVDKVWSYNEEEGKWRLYYKGHPEVTDLENLKEGEGYFMLVTEDCTLIYAGHTYSLKKGWNLKGWLGG